MKYGKVSLYISGLSQKGQGKNQPGNISFLCAYVLQTELSMKKVYNLWGIGSQTFNAKCVCLHAQSIERKRSSVYNNTMNGSCYDRTIL